MITWSRDGAIARITLDRPAQRNAIPTAGWLMLRDVVAEVGRSDVRAVILSSAVPGSFSAGADLADLGALASDPPARTAFREAMRAGIEAVAALPMPVVAAVDGGCYGAAVALALAADFRIAGDGAVFATTPAKLGIGYPGEDVARLIGRVGRGQAARMLLVADPIDADEAYRIGLAELRAPDALIAADSFAERIATLAPDAVRMLKRTLADPHSPAVARDFDAAFGGAEFAERLTAFRERKR
ncbi:enoyl-CoA hydratase/isomerase family protein [Sphingomonas cannabina]|uniref:enoyl-CoA hydratase/isomerase family protein n=1 Tax=Sphingomonas cannabina TaxID=2899123 RepID=UPI001F257D13|nr:enoyl-CoA hydratase/isomerase family protein [Sphingomonas cannabina]UIJ43618.1 enoyl-CoA hydratase/isomerase family protein [Sphingomonas cannabina]